MQRLVATLALVALVALGLVAWLAWRGGGAGGSAVTPAPPAPLETPSERAQLAAPPPVAEASPVAAVEPARTPVRAEAASRPHGRVVDGASGAGVAGFRVRMLRVAKELATATSGANGVFQLPPTDGVGVLVDVEAQRGWAVVDRLVRVGDEHARGAAPIVVRVQRLAQAPIRGTLVDVATREPVPDMTLELRSRTTWVSETVVTDAAGGFATEDAFDEGRVLVELRDGEQDFGTERLDFGGGDEPVELAIQIGPTYRFRVLGAAPEPSELGALIVHDDDVGDAWSRESATVHADGDAYRTRMRRSYPAERGRRLLVARRNGMAFGLAGVDATVGRHERVLLIEMTPCGTVRGVVRGPDRNVFGYHVALRPAGETGAPARSTTADSDGNFALHFVPPGVHVLSVNDRTGRGPALIASARSEPWSRDVLVVAGETTRVEVDLLPLRRLDGGPYVDFVVRSIDAATGAPLHDAALRVFRALEGTEVVARGNEIVLAQRPENEEFAWYASAEGYARAFGDHRAFATRESGGERPRLVAEVALERGWAQLFGVLGHDGPVAGAAIRLDGVLAATTDAEGRALVRMEREPQRIEVRHPAHVPYESTLSEALIWSSWVHGGCDLWLEGR